MLTEPSITKNEVIEVTPEMIEAGAAVLRVADPGISPTMAEILTERVLREAEKVRLLKSH
jgi:hypothetical protein